MIHSAPPRTITRRNYPLLLSSQFLSALADNAILSVILGPIMLQAAAGTISVSQQQVANIIYTSLLFVPYLVFAPAAGWLNDRFAKTQGLIIGNLIKVLGALLALISLAHENYWLGIGYFTVGIGACLYSPAKYGILPEILPADRLVKANGTVELLTLMAILVGNIVGGIMVDRLPLGTCYTIVISMYAVSSLLNIFMVKTPNNREVYFSNTMREFNQNFRDLFSKKRLVKILIGTSLFWICGAMMKMNFQPWGQQVLQLKTMTSVALLGLWLTIGVMIGSVLAGQLHKLGDLQSTRKYGLSLAVVIAVISGTVLMIRFGLDNPKPVVIGLLIIAGVFAGLFLIPLNAALQAETHQGKLGKTIASQNLLENVAMLSGSVFAYLNVSVGVNPSQLFLALAVLVAVVSVFLYFPKENHAVTS
ncbi:MAG: MFS transporter [Verrucomicrobiales bacterium]